MPMPSKVNVKKEIQPEMQSMGKKSRLLNKLNPGEASEQRHIAMIRAKLDK